MSEPGEIGLHIKLTPKARRNRIGPMVRDAGGNPVLKISVTAVPENGKANAALIKLLAKSLGLAKGNIKIVAGHQSRNKKLRFTGDAAVLTSRIQQLAEKGK